MKADLDWLFRYFCAWGSDNSVPDLATCMADYKNKEMEQGEANSLPRGG